MEDGNKKRIVSNSKEEGRKREGSRKSTCSVRVKVGSLKREQRSKEVQVQKCTTSVRVDSERVFLLVLGNSIEKV